MAETSTLQEQHVSSDNDIDIMSPVAMPSLSVEVPSAPVASSDGKLKNLQAAGLSHHVRYFHVNNKDEPRAADQLDARLRSSNLASPREAALHTDSSNVVSGSVRVLSIQPQDCQLTSNSMNRPPAQQQQNLHQIPHVQVSQAPSSSTSTSSPQVDICSIPEQPLADGVQPASSSGSDIVDVLSEPKEQQGVASARLHAQASLPGNSCTGLHGCQGKSGGSPSGAAQASWNLGPVVRLANRLKRKLSSREDAPMQQHGLIPQHGRNQHKDSKQETNKPICQHAASHTHQGFAGCPLHRLQADAQPRRQSAQAAAFSLQPRHTTARTALPCSSVCHKSQQRMEVSRADTAAQIQGEPSSKDSHQLELTRAGCGCVKVPVQPPSTQAGQGQARLQDLHAMRATALLLQAKQIASDGPVIPSCSIHHLRQDARDAMPQAVASQGFDCQRVTSHSHEQLDPPQPGCVEVPVQRPSTQAGHPQNRCQDLQSVRDDAVLLHDGRMAHQEALSCLSSIHQLRQHVLGGTCQGVAAHQGVVTNAEGSSATKPLQLQAAASDASNAQPLQEIWGLPKDEGHPQPIRDTVKTVVRQQQQAAYQSFLKDRQHRNTHHPKGTSKSMQGQFSLLRAFESITSPALQRQLLEHSLQLLEFSRESSVQLLRHDVQSAGELMGMLRQYAPEGPQDDHLLMLQGPFPDMDQRQAAMVRNPEVRLKCDEQTSKAWLRSWERSNATTADFCDSGGAAELAVKALFPQMHCWAAELQMAWGLRAEDALEYSCVVEALMAGWVAGDLPAPATQGTIPYAHQVDLSKWESALGPHEVRAGPSLYATPAAPLPCHRLGVWGEQSIPAGFPYTPNEWNSASATALASVDDGCGAAMAQCHETNQSATNLTGVSSGLAILSSLFTRTNFHVEDTLLGAYNVMSYGAPKIWYVVPAESSKQFEAALERQQGPHALALLTAKHLYCSLPLPVLKQLGVKRFLQLPGYAVLTFPGAVYHWTVSTGFSLAEATNLYVGQPGRVMSHLQEWYPLLCTACTQAVKQDQPGLTESLLGRVGISQAIVQVLLQGPLSQEKQAALHRQALGVLKQLQALGNFLDG